MNKKLIGKTLDNRVASKVVSDFHCEDYAVRDKSEILVTAAQMKDYKARLMDELTSLSVSSGVTALANQIKSIESMIKELDSILATREFDDDDKILVQLTKDDVVQVNDNGETRYETEEVVNVNELTYYEVKYRVASLEEFMTFNSRTGMNANTYFNELVNKLISLNLHCVVSIAKIPLTQFDADVVTDIVSRTTDWSLIAHLLTVNATKLNSNLKIYPGHREELIRTGFIIRYTEKKSKVPTSVQLNLFSNAEEETVEIVSDTDMSVPIDVGDLVVPIDSGSVVVSAPVDTDSTIARLTNE